MSTLEVIRQDITDIKSYQTEIRVMLFGNNGNNGMNSNIKSLSSDMRDLRESLAILTTLVKNT